jgi:cysteine desulfurase
MSRSLLMRIYLDHNATTPVRDEVCDAMSVAQRDIYGNPSSTHAEGASAKSALARARELVASCLHTAPRSVYFTAGATEANNTVLQGLLAEGGAVGHVVTSTVEHPSVVEPCAWLERAGMRVTRLPVDGDGLLVPGDVAAAIEPDTKLVTLIWANNETGVVQPMREIAEVTSEAGVPLHVDATQAVGKWPVSLEDVPADYLSCSAHKFNGPKGVGALIVREGRDLQPLLRGGGQERRHRGGTENLPGIVGLGVACELAEHELGSRMRRYAELRDRLWTGLYETVPNVRRNGSHEYVLPNSLNIEFCDTAGELLLEALDLEGVAVSAGAACHSGSITPSHVLTAMGRTPDEARGCLRLSVGHAVDEAQVDRVIEVIGQLVPRVREVSDA